MFSCEFCKTFKNTFSTEHLLVIASDNNSGLRPIGVVEVLRRTIGKVIVSVVLHHNISSIGSLQVCAGHESGCETVLHAMHTIFEEKLQKQFYWLMKPMYLIA